MPPITSFAGFARFWTEPDPTRLAVRPRILRLAGRQPPGLSFATIFLDPRTPFFIFPADPPIAGTVPSVAPPLMACKRCPVTGPETRRNALMANIPAAFADRTVMRRVDIDADAAGGTDQFQSAHSMILGVVQYQNMRYGMHRFTFR